MSDYTERPRRRGTRTREPEYVETEDVYARGSGSRDLVVRPRDDHYDDDYPSEYRRRSYREDYGPPERRARSHGLRRDSYYEDDYTDYGARSRRGRDIRYGDDYYDDYDRPRERRKSRVEGVLEDLGLGGVAAAVIGKTRSRSRRRRYSDEYDGRSRGYSRSRSRDRDNRRKWQQAAQAAVLTGVIEAVRSRKEPGGWTGTKGQRVATAALGAAGIDGFLDRDPNEHSKRHIVESVVGGLGINRVANGPREASGSRGRSQSRGGARSRSRSIIDRVRSRSRSVFGRDQSTSRGRGRSQSRGPGVKELVGAGALAAAGKAIYNRVRSKSRGRLERSRSRSVGSDDSYVPSRRPRYAGNRDRGGPSDEMDRGRQAEQQAGGAARGRSSSSSSVSTTDLENQRKKTRGKELLTAGLATVATIHAAHGVYSSMVASDKRHKLVSKGEMSPEEARKRKSKNILQDAAAVGIAALGIKSAYAEWKEMNESRKQKHEIEKRHRRHKKMRERRLQGGGGGGGKYGDFGGGYGGVDGGYGGAGGGYGGHGGYLPQQAIGQYGSGSTAHYDNSNPYQAYSPTLPPPPVGGPPR